MIEKFDESEFFRMLKGHLDERTSRLVAAAAAAAVTKDAVREIAAASGYSRSQLRNVSSGCVGGKSALRRPGVA